MRSRALLLLPLLGVILLLPSQASAAVSCPNPIPVVNENNCMGSGSTAWRLTNYDPSGIAGYATQTSVNLGQSVTLRIARNGGFGLADINVFRMGWYGGAGGRLVYQASSVPIGNGSRDCNTPDFTTGLWDCANWDDTTTIPGSSLPASGVYIARIRDLGTGADNQIIFTVRDDQRQSDLLYKLPIATYEAYNYFNGKSLYDFNSAGFQTVTGSARAAKVSFDRPFTNVYDQGDWFLKADLSLVSWLERQGYDINYTDNVSVSANPSQLLSHRALVISGHDEYWSGAEMAGYKAARDAGINIASFSGNTAYWKVRYEDNNRTLVDYKTVAGNGVSGKFGVNDPGPDGIVGTADDALGRDGIAGTSDDNPQNATTTWRDNGAPPGDPNAPPQGRVGPDQPENSLLGSMYVGDNDNVDYPMTVPPANQQAEFAGDRIWRHAGISQTTGATIGSSLTGWEWDSIPTQAQYLSREPSGIKRLTQTDVGAGPTPPEWIQDEGSVYAPTPPPGQPSTVSAVKYTAPSGALVFHAGTIQWSWGLAPHYLHRPSLNTYQDPPVDSSDSRIQQATYNVLSDMNVQPNTPSGVNLEGNDSPIASFTASPNPVHTGDTVTFDASGSNDLDGTIAKYEWDLDGNGTYETDTGTNPIVHDSYASTGTLLIRMRVTDNGGATDETTRTLSVSNAQVGQYAASVMATPGLAHYWRLGEQSGTTFADSVGGSPATTQGGVTLGTPSALPNEGDPAASFDGLSGAATAQVDLSGTSQATIEFWLNWSAYSINDNLAFELTPNFNNNDGGFLVDPNAGEMGGQFGIGIGRGTTRNNVYFQRPSAGVWHHYAIVLNTQAPAGQQIIPYVDGQPVPYTKLDSGTGAGNFANSTLNFMSRDATSLFGKGSLDEVALYNQDLSPATIYEHFTGQTLNQKPTAAFTTSPNPAPSGANVSFDASASADPDGTIAKYEWDLDGNGTYETDTGSTPSVSHSYVASGSHVIGLRVTDDGGATATVTHTLVVSGGSPGFYSSTVMATPGLAHYWRLGEQSGTTFADSVGGSPATAQGGVTLSTPSPFPDDSDGAASFDGLSGAATAQVDLSGTSQTTIEFWLNWSAYSNNDALAFELTPNFNNNDGGFLVDPNAGEVGGQFAISIGRGTTRNDVYFQRPSAGVWHHYAIVLNTQAPADQQIIPYVDGQPVPYTKLDSGTGAGNFANSTLNFMSRAAASLFGNGSLDEVALYNQDLSPATIAQHFDARDPNRPPTASFTASPNPALSGANVSFDASASTDPDGTVAKYEWDLDGNGTYETNTGSTPSVSHSYATGGSHQIGLRVTDDRGATATATRTENVLGPYSAGIVATPGLVHYWRLGEQSGTTFADSVGGSPATAQGGVTLGTQSPLPNEGDPAASFDGASGAATAQVDLSGTSQATIEFWLNWSAYSNNDALAFELTPNFNNNDGGFLVDPNAGEPGGQFGIGIGRGTTRNNVYFQRPSAGVWHHYAIVLNTQAPADQQIIPYVDGQPVPYAKLDSGTGAGNFANSTLNFMSRDATSLFGKGSLDEVALYNQDLSPATIARHFSQNQPPTASFTASPNPALSGANVSFDASASTDPDGTVAKYEWDLDGNGTYETNTGSTPSVSQAYATPGVRQVGLQVTDNNGATATTTSAVTIQNRPPTASFTASPNPAVSGANVSFDASASTDPDGTVAKYEWDLDGNGTYETNTGSTPSVVNAFTPAGNRTIGLRVTDNSGATATTTQTVSIIGPYYSSVTSTSGLIDYWRLGELSGTTLADSIGGRNATARNGVILGVSSPLTQDPNTAVSFDGSNDNAWASLNLSGTPRLTVEFWLKWSAYANDDKLAFEFTSNTNNNNGGFMIDPDATGTGGRFGVSIGRNASRNSVSFVRPTAGVWHHYAIVFNTTVPGAQQIIPYVDGQAVSFTKTSSGTGAGNFANSTLNFMSRNGSSLFGKGSLDDVTIYNRTLTAAEISAHFKAR